MEKIERRRRRGGGGGEREMVKEEMNIREESFAVEVQMCFISCNFIICLEHKVEEAISTLEVSIMDTATEEEREDKLT